MKEKIIMKFSNAIHNTVMDRICESKSDPNSKEVYLNGEISYDEIIIKIDEIAYLGEIYDIINKLKGRDRTIRYDNHILGEDSIYELISIDIIHGEPQSSMFKYLIHIIYK